MKLYNIDIAVVATAYIKAETPEDAMRIARSYLTDEGLHVPVTDSDNSTVPVCGLPFDSEDLPDLSLSPAMTLVGPLHGHRPDEVHDYD